MNSRQLKKLGVPDDCISDAISLVQDIVRYNREVNKDNRINVKDCIVDCTNDHKAWQKHYYHGILDSVRRFCNSLKLDAEFVPPEPISYNTWGTDIDEATHEQMKNACGMPNASKAALMADAHLGYGLPIGGVLGLENAVSPHAVGVDIACRMKLSVFPIEPEALIKNKESFEKALWEGSRFGMGYGSQNVYDKSKDHEVMDLDWSVSKITRQNKDIARIQLGTSGGGNHFVEWGVVEIYNEELGCKPLVALMSHSGSRGVGAQVCKYYDGIARIRLPNKYSHLSHLAWLDMNSEEGQEYWETMQLMGKYAQANHDVIHRNMEEILGVSFNFSIENHHNFAWKEVCNGKELIVHRKGATPAGKGVWGVIPGSMGTPAYIVEGLGNELSLNSASHGAGRKLSRKKAKDKYTWNAVKNDLAKKGITVLAAGADEVPGAYKNIDEVLDSQKDLVKIVGKFEPKIVRMAGEK